MSVGTQASEYTDQLVLQSIPVGHQFAELTHPASEEAFSSLHLHRFGKGLPHADRAQKSGPATGEGKNAHKLLHVGEREVRLVSSVTLDLTTFLSCTVATV